MRGLTAGAVGTMALDAVTYLDMALTGRAASTAPGETVVRTADALGVDLPKGGARVEAYGALGGIAAGLGVGVAASLARAAGIRLPAPVGATLIGATAMAAADVPMAATGVLDPRSWAAADWVRDAVPHLAYGAGVRCAMDWPDRRSRRQASRPTAVPPASPAPPPSAVGTLLRSFALGAAVGGRSSLAVGGPVLASVGGKPALVAAGLVTAELVVDKLPVTPSRLRPGALGARWGGGTLGAVGLARHRDAGPALSAVAALAGGAGAFVGSVLGAGWRDVAERRGWADWQAGLLEDGIALGLTAVAWR